MRAFRYHEHGTSDVLKLERIPVPEPKKDDVLVRVSAVGVRPVEWKQRRGMNPTLLETGVDAPPAQS